MTTLLNKKIDAARLALLEAVDVAVEWEKNEATRRILISMVRAIERQFPELMELYNLPKEAGCDQWYDCSLTDFPVVCDGCRYNYRLK
jgi:hypothetical protein